MIRRLILVRHAETVHNLDGVAQGWSDSELSERGMEQVRRLALRAGALGPTSLYSSPLARARTTAEAIADSLKLPLHLLEDLREMHCGRWEGMTFVEIRENDGDEYHRWAEDPSVPCPEGESFEDVSLRMSRALETIQERENGSAAVPLIVSHGTAIRIAATTLLGLPLSTAKRLMQENAAVSMFDRRGETYLLRCWNDATHCAQEGPE